MTMNSPLLRAAALIFSIASIDRHEIRRSRSITICTGKPPIEAGSGGSEKTKALHALDRADLLLQSAA